MTSSSVHWLLTLGHSLCCALSLFPKSLCWKLNLQGKCWKPGFNVKRLGYQDSTLMNVLMLLLYKFCTNKVFSLRSRFLLEENLPFHFLALSLFLFCLLLEREDPHPSHFFWGCDTIPWQKKLKGEGFIWLRTQRWLLHTTSGTERDGCCANVQLSFSILGSLGSQPGNGDTHSGWVYPL